MAFNVMEAYPDIDKTPLIRHERLRKAVPHEDATMVMVSPAAVARLKALILEHPDDPVVRLAIKDLDEERLVFSITLEAEPQPDDEVQAWDGLTVAIAANSAPRMEGVTLDYAEPGGFTFRHPASPDEDALHEINMN